MKQWTSDEEAELLHLTQQGKTVRQIARALGRTTGAVYMRARRIGGLEGARRDPYAAVRSGNDVARLLGVHETTVGRWVHNKWLRATRNQHDRTHRSSNHRHFLITDEALQEFIADRRYWPEWQPSLINDVDWREYARQMRAEAGGHWLSLQEIARMYGVAHSSVRTWRNQGEFKHCSTTECGYQHFVWSADLANFVPPRQRGKATVLKFPNIKKRAA